MRTKTTFRDGEMIETEEYPKFDDPRPAVLLEVEANATLYAHWKRPLLDVYPTPLNLEEVQASLEVPEFLAEVFERNRAGSLKGKYDDINTFDDSIAYMAMVDEHGIVDEVGFSGSSPCSVGTIDRYPPMIKHLMFNPGRIGTRNVRCQVVVRVRHTFVEARPGPGLSRS